MMDVQTFTSPALIIQPFIEIITTGRLPMSRQKPDVANADRWGTSAAFGVLRQRRNLDLYVANYVDVDMNNLPKFGNGLFCQYRGIPVNMRTARVEGRPRSSLYHNNGDGTFTDVTEKLGIRHSKLLRPRRVVARLRQGPDASIFTSPMTRRQAYLYHNDCKGGFTEVGAESGVAYSSDGREQAGMGIDAAALRS